MKTWTLKFGSDEYFRLKIQFVSEDGLVHQRCWEYPAFNYDDLHHIGGRVEAVHPEIAADVMSDIKEMYTDADLNTIVRTKFDRQL